MTNLSSKGKDLVNHWNWATEKGLMNSNTASALRAACTQVLGSLDNWEEIEIQDIDIEDAIFRFNNLRAKDFTPSSLNTYASRFRKAVESFQSYVSNPSGWKPTQRAPKSKKPKESNQPKPKSIEVESAPPPQSPADDLIQYPFPLRDGLIAVIKIPANLSQSEATRMAAFLTALAIPDEL